MHGWVMTWGSRDLATFLALPHDTHAQRDTHTYTHTHTHKNTHTFSDTESVVKPTAYGCVGTAGGGSHISRKLFGSVIRPSTYHHTHQHPLTTPDERGGGDLVSIHLIVKNCRKLIAAHVNSFHPHHTNHTHTTLSLGLKGQSCECMGPTKNQIGRASCRERVYVLV